MSKEQVRQSYASVADLYIEPFGTIQQVHPDDLAFAGRHLVSRHGAVLDLGCGPGHITDYLRALGVDATGIDMVPGLFQQSSTDDGRRPCLCSIS